MGIFSNIRSQLNFDPARDLGQPLSDEQILTALKSDLAEPTLPSPFAELTASILSVARDRDKKKVSRD